MRKAVPVLVITLCRYDHFVRCIQSLEKNALAEQTELFVGIDHPFKEEHWEGYLKICKFLENSDLHFKKIHVLKHEKNVGVEKNHYLTRDLIYENYDSYIFSEDDNEFSCNYLDYMNQMMEEYRNNESVVAISGYMYPIYNGKMNESIIGLDTYFSAFGYGIWKNKDREMCDSISMLKFEKFYKDRKKMKLLRKRSLNQYCNFVKGMVEYIPELVKNNEVTKIDLSYGLYMFFNHKFMVFPRVSKVRNTGYDGSGVNCRSVSNEYGNEYHAYDYTNQPIDQELHFVHNKEDLVIENNFLDAELNKFFHIGYLEKSKTVFVYYLSLVIGRENTAKIIHFLSQEK